MIYFEGPADVLNEIQQNLDKHFEFVVDESALDNPKIANAQLILISAKVANPVKRVQQFVAKDKLVSVIILAGADQYNSVKKSLQFAPAVGKNASCMMYNPGMNYSSVFESAISRTLQKRSFSKFQFAAEGKLAGLNTAINLDNVGNILEHAPLGAILLKEDFTIIGANKSSRKMFNPLLSAQTSLNSLFPFQHVKTIRDALEQGNQMASQVEDYKGNYYEISVSRVGGHGPDTFLILIGDITQKRENDKRVEAILESLPQMAWSADAEGHVTYFSQAWYTYTNIGPDESLAEGWTSAVHIDDLPLVSARWNDSVKNGKAFEQAVRVRKFNGEYRWHFSKAVPVYLKNQQLSMWVGTTTDIHDQVLLTEELESKVKERTRLLEESNAELEQFAHISSHDLQEPLRKIHTFANIIREEADALPVEDFQKYIDKIIQTSQRMSKSLKDLLNFTRINQHEDQVLIDMNELITQIKEDLELTISQTNATVEVDDLPSIKARPLQIRQLFYNLINNALKFRRPDVAPVITISSNALTRETIGIYKSLSESIAYRDFIVRDNGIGFDQKYANQIFTVFQRLHSRSAYEGTGIGLAIARKVVTNHKGEIFALSSPGEGSEFHIILPE